MSDIPQDGQQVAQLVGRLNALQAEHDALRQQIADLTAARDQAVRDLAAARDRAAALEKQIAEAPKDTGATPEALAAAQAERDKAKADYATLAAKFDAMAGEPVSPCIRRRTAYTYLTDDDREHPTQADALRHDALRHTADALSTGDGFVPRDAALRAMTAIRRAATPKPEA